VTRQSVAAGERRGLLTYRAVMLIHRYDPPERFVTGTVGAPGERTFFLQARAGVRITSVVLEKQQVQVLADRIEQLLDQVAADSSPEEVSDLLAEPITDTAPLDQPIEEEFRVGAMTLSWDGTDGVVVIEAFAVKDASDSDDDADGTAESGAQEDEEIEADEAVVVHVRAPMARGFARRAKLVVSAGREQCPFCGGPMDPSGHLCPRSNGYLRTPRA
jgi:uncharacterized repeat protein (TIGR03847 family)